MKIEFQSELQHQIADMMWRAQDHKQVKQIIKVYGKDAEVVFYMIMAHYFDNEMDTDLAEEFIERIK